jgi:hypothetical protein
MEGRHKTGRTTNPLFGQQPKQPRTSLSSTFKSNPAFEAMDSGIPQIEYFDVDDNVYEDMPIEQPHNFGWTTNPLYGQQPKQPRTSLSSTLTMSFNPVWFASSIHDATSQRAHGFDKPERKNLLGIISPRVAFVAFAIMLVLATSLVRIATPLSWACEMRHDTDYTLCITDMCHASQQAQVRSRDKSTIWKRAIPRCDTRLHPKQHAGECFSAQHNNCNGNFCTYRCHISRHLTDCG